MIVKIDGLCQYDGCQLPATHIARGRNHHAAESAEKRPELGVFCETHANVVSDEGVPEYTVSCPNCDCMFGVN